MSPPFHSINDKLCCNSVVPLSKSFLCDLLFDCRSMFSSANSGPIRGVSMANRGQGDGSIPLRSSPLNSPIAQNKVYGGVSGGNGGSGGIASMGGNSGYNGTSNSNGGGRGGGGGGGDWRTSSPSLPPTSPLTDNGTDSGRDMGLSNRTGMRSGFGQRVRGI